MSDRRWCTRDEIADIHEAIATHHPAVSTVDQEHQRLHMEKAVAIRELDKPLYSPGIYDAGRAWRLHEHMKSVAEAGKNKLT